MSRPDRGVGAPVQFAAQHRTRRLGTLAEAQRHNLGATQKRLDRRAASCLIRHGDKKSLGAQRSSRCLSGAALLLCITIPLLIRPLCQIRAYDIWHMSCSVLGMRKKWLSWAGRHRRVGWCARCCGVTLRELLLRRAVPPEVGTIRRAEQARTGKRSWPWPRCLPIASGSIRDVRATPTCCRASSRTRLLRALSGKLLSKSTLDLVHGRRSALRHSSGSAPETLGGRRDRACAVWSRATRDDKASTSAADLRTLPCTTSDLLGPDGMPASHAPFR